MTNASLGKAIKTYYHLAKPGIVRGNALNAITGFFLASRWNVDWWLLFAMLAGISCIVASSCVINNYIDRDIDARMERTKKRALVTDAVSGKRALFFAAALAVLGMFLLARYTNFLALGLAILGAVIYVGPYTFLKRKTPWATEIGSIAGAVPPLVGYVAVTQTIDIGAIILFAIFVLWQMPHFFAIAIYRQDEYAAAGVPVLPVAHGVQRTKVELFVYILAFTAAVFTLPYAGLVGPIYVGVMSVICGLWLLLAARGFWVGEKKTKRWARGLFFYSLLVVLLLCAVLILQR